MEDISKIFNKIKLKTYKTAQGDRFFDRIRNIFVNITPEETVRQRMIKYLIDDLEVPFQNIRVEDHLAHWNVTKYNGRMDIVLTYFDESNEEKVLAIIECKEENIVIESMQFFEQAENYAKLVKAKYIILVNGINIRFYHSENYKNYIPIEEILTYKAMTKNIHTYLLNEFNFERLDYSDYFDNKFLESQEWYYDKIGEDTPKNLIPCIINFDDCLWDSSKKLNKIISSRFSIEQDLGIRYRQYNDASNGGFGSGFYRIFMISDNESRNKFLSGFSIITTGKTYNDPKYRNQSGKSVLCIMYNDGNLDETSVQINLNTFLKLYPNKKAVFTHNGAISRKGARKEDFIKYVNTRNGNLIRKNNFYFGEVDYSVPLTLENQDIINLISNMIEYSVYRIEYKTSLSKLKK